MTSMGRGFEVISSVAALTAVSPGGVTVGDVARRLGRERSQVSRTLSTLAEQGLVVRDPARRYRLGWAWYASAQDLTDRRLRTAGLSKLDTLSSAVGEACFLSVLEGDSTVTVVESIPRSSRMIGSWISRAYPAFCSDAGQAVLWDADDDEVRDVLAGTEFIAAGPNAPRSVEDFLARLSAARDRGFAIVDEEAEPGLYSVSAPVWDFRGEVIAALQVVGMREALHPRTAELALACEQAARELSTMLGAAGQPAPASAPRA